MFDYDRLALDVAQEFSGNNIFRALHGEPQQIRSNIEENRVDLSTLDIFDCGSSSGYGSPGVGGTPLSSPAPNSASYISQSVQKMLLEHSYYNDLKKASTPKQQPIGTSPCSFDPHDFVNSLFSGMTIEQVDDSVCEQESNKLSTSSSGSNSSTFSPPVTDKSSKTSPVVATEDGFSQDEIAQFAELLCSPKKTPPTRYQCHICYNTGHYISDCPMRFNSPYEELTPYQGRKKCYGEFTCQQCKRRWTSQNSVANEAQSCIKCHVPVFPHKQLPVDKAVALGLVKAQRTVPTKIAPIGHGRPLCSAAARQ